MGSTSRSDAPSCWPSWAPPARASRPSCSSWAPSTDRRPGPSGWVASISPGCPTVPSPVCEPGASGSCSSSSSSSTASVRSTTSPMACCTRAWPRGSAGSAPGRCSSGSGSAIGSTTRRPSCRVANASGWPSRGRWSVGRTSCSPTSPPATSIRRPGGDPGPAPGPQSRRRHDHRGHHPRPGPRREPASPGAPPGRAHRVRLGASGMTAISARLRRQPRVVIPRSRLHPADLLGIGAVGLRARKVRSALTALGIAIGIAAMVAVLAVSESSRADLLAALDRLGTNLLTVTPGQSFFSGDVSLPEEAPGMLGADRARGSGVGDRPVDATVRRTDLIPETQTGGISVVAADLDLLETLRATVHAGRWLDGATERYPAAVLGWTAAERLGITTPGVRSLDRRPVVHASSASSTRSSWRRSSMPRCSSASPSPKRRLGQRRHCRRPSTSAADAGVRRGRPRGARARPPIPRTRAV